MECEWEKRPVQKTSSIYSNFSWQQWKTQCGWEKQKIRKTKKNNFYCSATQNIKATHNISASSSLDYIVLFFIYVKPEIESTLRMLGTIFPPLFLPLLLFLLLPTLLMDTLLVSDVVVEEEEGTVAVVLLLMLILFCSVFPLTPLFPPLILHNAEGCRQIGHVRWDRVNLVTHSPHIICPHFITMKLSISSEKHTGHSSTLKLIAGGLPPIVELVSAHWIRFNAKLMLKMNLSRSVSCSMKSTKWKLALWITTAVFRRMIDLNTIVPRVRRFMMWGALYSFFRKKIVKSFRMQNLCLNRRSQWDLFSNQISIVESNVGKCSPVRRSTYGSRCWDIVFCSMLRWRRCAESKCSHNKYQILHFILVLYKSFHFLVDKSLKKNQDFLFGADVCVKEDKKSDWLKSHSSLIQCNNNSNIHDNELSPVKNHALKTT